VFEFEGRQRVFFSSRDQSGCSHIGSVDLDADNAGTTSAVSATALISPGALGGFDDAGVTHSCTVVRNGRTYLFYTGWSLGVSVPFYLNVGLAVSDDGGVTFRKFSRAPLLDRNEVDPFLTASPWVIVENDQWRMWYVSGTTWQETGSTPRHRYHIKYAESADGINWRRNGTVCIDYQSPDEYAFGRPCVVHDGDRYRMWYSYRGERYRIGYAESSDGLNWLRRDADSGIDVSETGWDSEMVTYPAVDRHCGRWRMLYNGNDYGRTGFGLATSA
jgi:hypothetical protein